MPLAQPADLTKGQSAQLQSQQRNNLQPQTPKQVPTQRATPLPMPRQPQFAPPTTRQVGNNSTVQGQLNSILSSGNPLLERAKTRAAQAANKRGLLNSSMGVQAGQEAMMSVAMPMAQQDATTFNNQGLTNQTVQNQFNRDSNEYVRQRGLSSQDFGQTYQLKDQTFNQQTGGGNYGSGLIGAGREQQQDLLASEQSFGAGQSALGREQQQNLLASEQSFGAGQAELGRDFSSSEAQLGREQQTGLLSREQQFGAEQAGIDRNLATSEAERSRQQQTGLQKSEQDFSSTQAELGREQQTGLQESEQDFSSTQAALGREQQSELQKGQQGFAASESALGRQQQLTAMNQDYKNSVAQAKTAQEYGEANMTMQNGLQKQLVSLGHTNDLDLKAMDGDLEMGKISAEVYANTQGAYLQSVSELVRQTQITVGEIQMKEGISSEDKAKMMADQATLLTAHMEAQKNMYQGTATWDQDWADMPSASVDRPRMMPAVMPEPKGRTARDGSYVGNPEATINV